MTRDDVMKRRAVPPMARHRMTRQPVPVPRRVTVPRPDPRPVRP